MVDRSLKSVFSMDRATLRSIPDGFSPGGRFRYACGGPHRQMRGHYQHASIVRLGSDRPRCFIQAVQPLLGGLVMMGWRDHMKLTTMVLASSLVLVGCWESIELGGAEVPLDSTLTFTVDDVRISDVDLDNGRRLVVGLAEAGPANALIRILETGTTRTLAEVDANEEGGFAAGVRQRGHAIIRGRARNGFRGPETEFVLPGRFQSASACMISRLDAGGGPTGGLTGASAPGARPASRARYRRCGYRSGGQWRQFEFSAGEPGDELAVVSFLDGRFTADLARASGRRTSQRRKRWKSIRCLRFAFGTRRGSCRKEQSLRGFPRTWCLSTV